MRLHLFDWWNGDEQVGNAIFPAEATTRGNGKVALEGGGLRLK